MRKLVFSTSIKDCDVQHFRAGGNGGQHQNKTDSGTRVIHRPSGARGESREERSQLENKRKAFRKMAESKEFQHWVRLKALEMPPIDDIVEEMMKESNLKIEVRDSKGKWNVLEKESRDSR